MIVTAKSHDLPFRGLLLTPQQKMGGGLEVKFVCADREGTFGVTEWTQWCLGRFSGKHWGQPKRMAVRGRALGLRGVLLRKVGAEQTGYGMVRRGEGGGCY